MKKETNNSKAKMLWKSLPLKIKLIIIGIAIGFFFLNNFFSCFNNSSYEFRNY